MSMNCAHNRSNPLILLFLIPPVSIFILIFIMLWKNRLPWKKKPGRRKRLMTYLRTNKAETRDDSLFPELLTPVFKSKPDELYAHTIEACQKMNWKIKDAKASYHQVEAEISTPILKFKDDIIITIQPVTEEWSQLHVVSRSRKGKGDMGTNTRHILDLKQTLHKSLKTKYFI